MFNTSKKSIWYGQLETTSSKTPVIYDPGLPEPPRGQIYLYNSERNAILKYAAHIVQPMLKNLDDGERKKIEKSLNKKWQVARKTFLREYGTRSPHPRKKTATNAKQAKVKSEIEAPDTDDNDWPDNMEDFDST